jgi:23S rRNA (adenine2030-N6)-methyltransferase
MLAYRHLFHAGNFADVFKHAILTRVLLGLNKKEKPYFYLDTHAGIGLYDLQHEWAQKNEEHKDGIARVLEGYGAPEDLKPYLEIVRAHNAPKKLRNYPGSPLLARALMREHDRLVLSELNERDCEHLRETCEGDSRVHVHQMDGYQALKAFLPPPERRGVVLIDSSFDRQQEYKRLADGLREAGQRWATGTYVIWYPLMSSPEVDRFERQIAATGLRKILRLSLSVFPEHWTMSLRGSSMLIVNPPWGLDAECRKILPWLWKKLAEDGQGEWAVNWLVAE